MLFMDMIISNLLIVVGHGRPLIYNHATTNLAIYSNETFQDNLSKA